MTTPEVLYRDPNEDAELRTAICDWLKSNRIDPALVPADERPDCSYRDGGGMPLGGHTITTRIRIRCLPDSKAIAIRYGSNRPEETTITRPMQVAPPPIVQAWLDARCPTCRR